MKAMNKIALCCAVSSATLGMTHQALGAVALEEVVVTARKREEAAQDIPVAVTAITGETFQRAAITNFDEAVALAPGFNVNSSSFSPLAPNFSMRGSVQNSVNVTDDPSVGVYVDGVYVARPYGIGVDLLDLASVQILKGPQGTLFGRNTTAGAVLLSTNDPELGEFFGHVSATGGQDLTSGEFVVNVPLTDSIAVRIAHLDSRRDDYITNRAQDPNDPTYAQYNTAATHYRVNKRETTEIGGSEAEMTRIKLRFAPTDQLDMVLSHEEFEKFIDGPAREQVWLGLQPVANDLDDDQVSLDFDPYNFTKTKTDIFTLTYSTGELGEIKFTASLREYKQLNETDYDGGGLALPATDSDAVFGSLGYLSARRHGSWGRSGGEQETYELQWVTSFLDDRIDLTTGVTYFKEDAWYFDYSFGNDLRNTGNQALILAKTFGGLAGGNGMQIDDSAVGVYAQAVYHINDVSNLTVGLRRSEDDKNALIRGTSAEVALAQLPSFDFDAYYFNADGYYRRGGGALSVIDDGLSFSSTDWLLSYDYKISDDVLAYAKVSTGFRAGGFNGRGSNDPSLVPFTFEPEEILAYEVGVKGDFLDGQLRWNTALYLNKTEEKQFTVLIPNPNPAVPPGTANKNAGEAEAKGFETELTFLFLDNWSIAASYAYIDAEVTEALNSAGQKVSAELLPPVFMVPENEYTLSLNYDQDFEHFRVAGTAMYHWMDELNFNYSTAAEQYQTYSPFLSAAYTQEIFQAVYDAGITDSYGSLNLNLSISSLDDRYTLSLWSKNLLDERAVVSAIPSNFGIAYQYVNVTVNEPRTYGVTVKTNF